MSFANLADINKYSMSQIFTEYTCVCQIIYNKMFNFTCDGSHNETILEVVNIMTISLRISLSINSVQIALTILHIDSTRTSARRLLKIS